MLTSHNLAPKATILSPKAAFTPTHLSNSRLFLKDIDSPQKIHNKHQPSFHNTIDDRKNQLSLSPIKSPKGLSIFQAETKSSIQMLSLSPVRGDLKQSLRMNRGTHKSALDGSVDLSEIGARKQNTLQNSSIRTVEKKAKTTHHGPPLDDKKAKKLNLSQVKDFMEKYKIKYVSGHGNKAIEKCTTLLATENDPFILENLFPGQYTMYTNLNTSLNSDYAKGSSKFSLASIGGDKMSSFDASTPYYGGSISFLPNIRNKRHETETDSHNFRAYTEGQIPDSRSSVSDNKLSAISSIFGVKKWKALPPVEAESFRESLSLYQDFIHKSALLVIEAIYKEASMDIGFCEVVWDDENKTGTFHMSKFFVQKVYNKMGFLVPITINVIDHLFKTYNFEKLTTDLLTGNEVMCEALSIAGMKLGKQISKNNQKWQVFTLKRKDFYNWFQDIFGTPVNNSPTSSPLKTLGK